MIVSEQFQFAYQTDNYVISETIESVAMSCDHRIQLTS